MRMQWRAVAVMLVGTLWLLGTRPIPASPLDPKAWKLNGPHATTLGQAVDHQVETVWESGGPQVEGTAVLIDLGQTVDVYRVYLTPGRAVSQFPRSLRIAVGATPDTVLPVASEDSLPAADTASTGTATALRAESDFRFAPTTGRFVKIAIGPNGAGQPWAIAELEIHATPVAAPATRLAVVLDAAARQPVPGKPVNLLSLAASDLQYYLMELTNQPVDIIATEDAATRPGRRIWLVTPPAEQIPHPEPDPRNLDDISVVRDGEDVRITGRTTRAVFYGAAEFLRSQGVRWLYPSPHGELVPARGQLDLSVLPLTYRPPFSTRGLIDARMVGVPASQAARFELHHGLNLGIDRAYAVGTPPRMNAGFGWAHTMGELFDGQEKLHPDWWPGPYRKGWYQVPDTTNPAVTEFIMQRIEKALGPRAGQSGGPAYQGFSVHPNDAPAFAETAAAEKLFGKLERLTAEGSEESCSTWNYSDHHFYLINQLATRLQQTHPELFLKTLAYANHERPPKHLSRLPDNVLVDICPWWAPLPVAAPQNQAYRELLQAWPAYCRSLGIWSYVLIYSDTTFGNPAGEKNVVVANATAIVDQNRFYQRQGIRQVSSQLYGPQEHWPWALYAFCRTTWQPDEPAAVLLQEFFHGYYGAAGAPMLRWYTLLEQSAISQAIDTSAPDPRLFACGLIEPLRAALAEASQKADTWYARERVAQAQYDTEWTYRQAQWRTQAERPYPCYRLPTPPTLDGTLADPVWQTLPELAGFRLVATRENAAHPGRFAEAVTSRFRMGWDDQYLYLGATCDEPAVAPLKEADAKDKDFVYRTAMELFFAPDAPPYYRQAMISSGGFRWGPVKIRAVNSDEPINDPNFSYRTAHTPTGWSFTVRFPLAMLARELPKDGTIWPANLVRVSTPSNAIGEQYSAWSDMPRLHFHQYDLGTWSVVTFRDATLTAAAAAAATAKLNEVYAQWQQDTADQRARLATFEHAVAGKDNLAALPTAHWSGGDRDSRQFILTWDKAPVTFDAVRVVWTNNRLVRPWYSLEYWDGNSYRLLAEVRDNRAAVSTHTFAPVTGSRVRLTIWPALSGWTDGPSVKALEVYQR